jgi:hypothetical protein
MLTAARPNNQRDRGDDLEVDQCPQAHAAHRFHVASPGDARDQCRKDKRRDDHLDQPQEQLAERTEVNRGLGIGVIDDRSDDDADGKADEDLMRQGNTSVLPGRVDGTFHNHLANGYRRDSRTTGPHKPGAVRRSVQL